MGEKDHLLYENVGQSNIVRKRFACGLRRSLVDKVRLCGVAALWVTTRGLFPKSQNSGADAQPQCHSFMSTTSAYRSLARELRKAVSPTAVCF